MTSPSSPPAARPGAVVGARWALVALAGLFVLGAFTQFFLVGLGMFEDGRRWDDHANLGHAIGMIPWVMWIPAVMGKIGRGLIVACLVLWVDFELQYAFIEASSGMLKALHPLNGSILLAFSGWILLRAVSAARLPEGSPA